MNTEQSRYRGKGELTQKRDVILYKDVENALDGTYDQRISLIEN